MMIIGLYGLPNTDYFGDDNDDDDDEDDGFQLLTVK